jgi:hypothetical protein
VAARPTTGIGREFGIASACPFCNRSRYPASILAAWEKGGVLISPPGRGSSCRSGRCGAAFEGRLGTQRTDRRLLTVRPDP